MKKIIPLALLMCVLMVVATYCTSWFLQARALRQNVEAWVNSVNNENRKITYDAIETTGFPKEMIVRIRNPHFVGRADLLLSDLARYTAALKGQSAGMLAPPTYAQWQEDAKLNGNLVLTINMLSNVVRLKSEGTWSNTSTFEGKTVSLNTEFEGALMCELVQKATPASFISPLWSLDQMRLNKETLDSTFKSAACNIPAYTVENATTNQVLLSGGASQFSLYSTPSDTRTDVKFALQLHDIETLPEGDEIYTLYHRAMTPQGQWATPAHPSMLGKQNADIGLSLSAPKDEAKWKSEPVRFELAPFKISNAAFSTDGSISIDSAPNKDDMNVTIHFTLATQFAEAYGQMSKLLLNDFVTAIYAGDILQIKPDTLAKIRAVEQERTFNTAWQALPDITQMGTFTQTFDAQLQGKLAAGQGKMDIKALELSSRDYGLNAKGTLEAQQPNQLMPETNVTLRCRNCDTMLDTLYSYQTRVQTALAQLDGSNTPRMSFTQAQLSGAKQFLGAVGAVSTADNAVYHDFAISINAGNITINQKPMAEIMTLYQASMVPAAQ